MNELFKITVDIFILKRMNMNKDRTKISPTGMIPSEVFTFMVKLLLILSSAEYKLEIYFSGLTYRLGKLALLKMRYYI